MVETDFRHLVEELAFELYERAPEGVGRRVRDVANRFFGVGGFLSNPLHAVTGIHDTTMARTIDGRKVITTEMKRGIAWPPGHHWHRHTRGVQLLSALYWNACPAFLATSAQYKLFVESAGRDIVYAYPFSGYGEVDVFGDTAADEFIQAIVICLLADRPPIDTTAPRSVRKLLQRPVRVDAVPFQLDFTPQSRPQSQKARVGPARRVKKTAIGGGENPFVDGQPPLEYEIVHVFLLE